MATATKTKPKAKAAAPEATAPAELYVEQRRLDTIHPYEQNPRTNDQAVDAVARSIQEFGFRQPIVVDAAGVIVCGHTRYKAAQKLGLSEVPVHVARELSPTQIRALRLADNKTHELADWDRRLLPIELSELQALGCDLSLTGFSGDELQRYLGTNVTGGATGADDVPAPPDDPITQRGDLWILGNHRLLCGDSSLPEDVARVLENQSVQLVNMDPPYNVKAVLFAGHHLDQRPPGPDAQGFHGRPRVVLLRMEGGRAARVPRAHQRHRRVGREEGQSAEHGAFDREARGARRAGHAVLIAAGRARAGSVRRLGLDADRRGAVRSPRPPGGARPAVLRRDRPALGGVHGPQSGSGIRRRCTRQARQIRCQKAALATCPPWGPWWPVVGRRRADRFVV